MRMIRLLSAVLVLGLLAAPALADFYAGPANLSQTGSVGGIQYSSGNGGEFTIDGTLLSTSAYAASTKGIKGASNSFQTFCVETVEFVASPVDLVVSTTWTPDGTPLIPQWGGAAVLPASHSVLGGQAPGDDLNPQTAYLYHQFATGTLGAYTYGVGRNVSAGSLQNAIWFLEGEQVLPGDAQAAAWVQEAVDASGLAVVGFNPDGSSGVGIGSWGQTIRDVRVVTTWGLGHYPGSGNSLDYKQDQLYLIPAPGQALLGVIGLGIVGRIRRRFA